jgi:hypothetical protein
LFDRESRWNRKTNAKAALPLPGQTV